MLTLTPLEDRTTPAAYAYAGGTLTITPATGDVVIVGISGLNVPGFLHATAGATNWDSGGDRPVRNLVVKGSTAANYSLLFGGNVWLSNLTVSGASGVGPFITTVILGGDTRVSGNFRFDGHPAGGDDSVFVGGPARMGGNVTLNMRGGNNFVDVGSGSIGGRLNVTTGVGNDTVNLVAVGPLMIGRDVKLNLGDGINLVQGLAANRLAVGRNFNFTGGSGDDQIDFAATPVVVGGSVNVDLRTPPAFVIFLTTDSWTSRDLTVGQNFTSRGGAFINLDGPNLISGNVSVTAGASGNTLGIGRSIFAGSNTAASAVGGSISFKGIGGADTVSLDNLTVERGVNLNLGGGGVLQNVNIGATQVGNVHINGSLTIRGDIPTTNLTRTHIGGSFGLYLGDSADVVVIDDSDFTGAAVIDLGGGGDNLSVDTRTNDIFLAVPLPNRTRFQSSLTVYGDDGADAVFLGTVAGGTGVNVAGPVRLFGGADNDTLTVLAGNLYLSTTSEDFEVGNF
jgi:hypothetical protein